MNLTQRAYCDRILRVDLSTGKIETTPLPEDVMPLILGGKGLGAWLLYTEQPAGIDPLSPENHLIWFTVMILTHYFQGVHSKKTVPHLNCSTIPMNTGQALVFTVVGRMMSTVRPKLKVYLMWIRL